MGITGVMGDDNAVYEAAVTLTSLISAPISFNSDDESSPSSWSRDNKIERDVVASFSSDYDNDATREEDIPVGVLGAYGTRKFTRSDEIHLIRGILKFGTSSWKTIWKEMPELQHIKHSALKDRGRSKRFKDVLKRAQQDPTLLDQPDELCGDEHSHWYEQVHTNTALKVEWTAKKQSAEEDRATNASPISNDFNAVGGAAEPLYTCGPLQDNKHEDDTKKKTEYYSLPSSANNTRAATKKKIVVVKKERNGNKKSKPVKAAASVIKKSPQRKTKVLPRNGNQHTYDSDDDEFPGWNVKKVQRKTDRHVDRFFSHPDLDGVVVRSRVGVSEMIAKMETDLVDANTAHEILMSEGKRKYFIGTRKS